MRRLEIAVLAAGTLVAMGVAPDVTAGALAAKVVVRVYDAAGTTDADRAAALATAAAILRGANIDTTWPDCQPQHPRPDLESGRGGDVICDQPMRPGEIAVRLLRGTTPRTLTGPVSLGYSLIDTKMHMGALATIYLDRIEWFAQAAGVDIRILAGRAIAHEIGHLLLGTDAHGRSGLMRPNWSQKGLQQGTATDWMFTGRERRDMQRSIARRTPALLTPERTAWGNRN